MNKISSYLPVPLASIAFLLSFLAYLVAAPAALNNPDTPWHLMAGDLIRDSGIPATDPWSFSAAGTPWYNLSWGWDVVISWVAARFGLPGLYIFAAMASASIIALLAYTVQRRNMISDLYIAITLLLLWYALLPYSSPQPWLATVFLTVVFHHLLHLNRERGGWHLLWWLPLLMIAWANLHGGFIAGFSLIAAYAIEAQQTRQYAWCRRLCIIMAACGLACFINPYGIHIVTGFLRTMDSVITAHLADWQPLPVGWTPGPTLFLLLFMFCSNIRDPRISAAEKIIVFAWLFYGIHTRRNFIIFAVLAAPYFSYCLESFSRYAQGARFKTTMNFIADSFANRAKFLAVALGALALVAWTPLKTWLIDGDKLNDDPYAIRPLLAALDPYKERRFLNDYNIGGNLIYVSRGAWPVFADGRAGTAYTEDILQDNISLNAMSPGFEGLFDKYGADGAIVLSTHRFPVEMCRNPQAGWKLVHKGEFVSAYVREPKKKR